MLLGAEQTGRTPEYWWIQPVSLVLGAVFLIVLVIVMVDLFQSPVSVANLPADFGSPKSVGAVLFSHYALPFEATSILLLIAMIGAILLTRPMKEQS
jgi:NADH-quinone oxidoreductase subunit J